MNTVSITTPSFLPCRVKREPSMFSKSAQAGRAWTKVARAARVGKRKGRTDKVVGKTRIYLYGHLYRYVCIYIYIYIFLTNILPNEFNIDSRIIEIDFLSSFSFLLAFLSSLSSFLSSLFFFLCYHIISNI